MYEEEIEANSVSRQIVSLISWLQINKNQFAQSVGVPQAILSHILSGRNKPSLEVVKKILVAYPQLNPQWLIFGKGEMFSTSHSADSSAADGSSLAVEKQHIGNKPDMSQSAASAGGFGYEGRNGVDDSTRSAIALNDEGPAPYSAGGQEVQGQWKPYARVMSDGIKNGVRQPVASKPARNCGTTVLTDIEKPLKTIIMIYEDNTSRIINF